MYVTTTIASDRERDVRYTVRLKDGEAFSCSCPDHRIRQHMCKHMRRAELLPSFHDARKALEKSGYSREQCRKFFEQLKNTSDTVHDAILKFIHSAEYATARRAA